jgi:hypothetical protein
MNSPVNPPTTTISASEFKQQKQSPESKLQVIDLRTHAEVESEF